VDVPALQLAVDEKEPGVPPPVEVDDLAMLGPLLDEGGARVRPGHGHPDLRRTARRGADDVDGVVLLQRLEGLLERPRRLAEVWKTANSTMPAAPAKVTCQHVGQF
jgi:hypothetical protein